MIRRLTLNLGTTRRAQSLRARPGPRCLSSATSASAAPKTKPRDDFLVNFLRSSKTAAQERDVATEATSGSSDEFLNLLESMVSDC